MATIVIAEDEQSIREMYALKLRSCGYDVFEAKDGKEAFTIISDIRPDLVLLDVKMPGLPGNEVLRKVRHNPWGAGIKVVVLTNISKSEAPQEFRFLNINSYIVKVHYTPSQVIDIVQKVLAQKK